MRVQVRADVLANLIVRYFFLIMICTGCYVEQLMKLYNVFVDGWGQLLGEFQSCLGKCLADGGPPGSLRQHSLLLMEALCVSELVALEDVF